MKIFQGDVVLLNLDCKETVDGQSDLWIMYKKPVSLQIGRWGATGVGDFAQFTTIKNESLDEVGTWIIQPYSDTYGVYGDEVEMPVFLPLFPFEEATASGFLEGTE